MTPFKREVAPAESKVGPLVGALILAFVIGGIFGFMGGEDVSTDRAYASGVREGELLAHEGTANESVHLIGTRELPHCAADQDFKWDAEHERWNCAPVHKLSEPEMMRAKFKSLESSAIAETNSVTTFAGHLVLPLAKDRPHGQCFEGEIKADVSANNAALLWVCIHDKWRSLPHQGAR